MAKSFVTLPVVERWDCHNCSVCCKGFTVILDAEDQARLSAQEWEKHPDFQGTRVMVKHGIFPRKRILAQRRDGSCVFLGEDGLCRIHKEFGAEAKPWACRMFPFQLTPVSDHVKVTMRRCCPSAARGLGRPLSEHVPFVRSLAYRALPADRDVPPPRLQRRYRRDWRDTLHVTDTVERLVLDERYPMVRRMVHALRFCESLSQAKLRNLNSDQLRGLVEVLEQDAVSGVDELFATQAAPGRTARLLFRQTAAEYVRMHPNLGARPPWSERVRLLLAATRFARGRGKTPPIHPRFPETTFEQLEKPMGHLAPEVMKPITSYFEAITASLQYCGAGRFGWSIVDGFRALALAYAVSCWMLRWLASDRVLTEDDAVQVVNASDNSHYYPLLSGARHRRRLRVLAQLDELSRLIVWYAR